MGIPPNEDGAMRAEGIYPHAGLIRGAVRLEPVRGTHGEPVGELREPSVLGDERNLLKVERVFRHRGMLALLNGDIATGGAPEKARATFSQLTSVARKVTMFPVTRHLKPSSLGKGPPLLAVALVWAFVTAAVVALTALGQSLKGAHVDLLERFVWEVGWMGWVPLTYLVIWLCDRYPIDRQHRLTSIARLAWLGIAVLVLQTAIDFGCNLVLGKLLRGMPFMWAHLKYIAVFKGHLYYGVFWMIVGVAHAYQFHARFLSSQVVASQLETKLANAELTLLKGQLQPHFLFNTHNAIISLILKEENAAAVRMLTRLSDLLRIALSHSRQQFVDLGEEMRSVRLYLEIQHERFRERLAVKVEVPEALFDAQVPHLILQPLVENALSHGLEDTTENGELVVRAARDSQMLVLSVRDNGCGFFPDDEASAVRTGGGVGLRNTAERLQQLYGAEQSLKIESAPGLGCTVTITLPYRQRRDTEMPLQS
jgi:two-component system, LytTR family, sensor kinase